MLLFIELLLVRASGESVNLLFIELLLVTDNVELVTMKRNIGLASIGAESTTPETQDS